MKKILALLLASVMVIGLFAGCGPKVEIPSQMEAATTAPKADDTTTEATEAPKELTFAQGTVLRMATGYNSTKTGLFFDAEVAGDGVTLADGKTYHAGDLKPTWVEVQNRLGMVF